MPLLSNNNLTTTPQNLVTELRDTFQTYSPGTTWNQTKDSTDIIQLDGNSVSGNYLVISKDPLTANTESSITTVSTFDCPIEITSGFSMSQRVLGQQLAWELFNDDVPVTPVADVAISSISQSTTTLTVTTSTSHGLYAGQRIGIAGITSDSRLNYPSLVVAAIVSTTSFTCTAGPMGTITSLTVGPYTNQGTVYNRPALGYATQGISEMFENATVTQASGYVIPDADNFAYPSGTAAGNHSVTVATTASVSAVSAAYTYAFVSTTEYRLNMQPDRVQWYDSGIDSASLQSSRILRTILVPDNTKQYKIRYRVTNEKSLTVPTAKIVSAAKAGSTTATITTATAHGLTTGNYVYITGIRNGTDFIPITTAVVVASTPTPTTFTLVYGGTSATTTSYGGLVARANGNSLPGGFAGAGSSASLQTATVTATELTLTSSGTFALSVGDYVNVYGVRDNTTGADLGIDGVYKVASVATTTAVFIPLSGTTLPAAFGSTNCGGAVIKRTDVRINNIRAFNYLRERVEILPRADSAGAVSVNMLTGVISSGTVTTVSTVSTLTGGAVAEDSATTANAVITGGVVRSTTTPITLIAGDAARTTMTTSAATVTMPYAVPEIFWSYPAAANGIGNTTTAVTMKAAAGASIRNYITGVQLASDTLGAATELVIRDGAAGTVIWRTKISTAGIPQTLNINFPVPLKSTANTLVEVATITAVTGNIYVNAQGFTGA